MASEQEDNDKINLKTSDFDMKLSDLSQKNSLTGKQGINKSKSGFLLSDADKYAIKNKYGERTLETEMANQEKLQQSMDNNEIDYELIKSGGEQLQNSNFQSSNLSIKKSHYVPKLSPIRTYFSLLKGFICTGILYMPKNFKNSGWLWGGIAMFISFLLTQLCVVKLLQARARHPGASYTDLGRLSMGKAGMIMTDVFLSVAQVGFLIGQTYFIASNIRQVVLEGFGHDIHINWFCLMCFIITTPLSYYREIDRFAFSYVLADILIFVTTIVILVFATQQLTHQGWGEGVQPFNHATWLSMIGSAVYAYEGFGTILPLLDVAEKPELFNKTLFLVLTTVFVVYTSFGIYCYCIYGDKLVDPLITAYLEPQGLLVYIIKVAFSINLVLTFPLTVYPANIIIESYIFGQMKQSKTRTYLKNLSRTIISLIGVMVCVAVGREVDKFISLSGTMACTPISFFLPAMFHLKLAGPLTKWQKAVDWAIIGLSGLILVFCTGFTLWTWND